MISARCYVATVPPSNVLSVVEALQQNE